MNREAGGPPHGHIIACSELHNSQTCSHRVLPSLPSTLCLCFHCSQRISWQYSLLSLQNVRKQLSCLAACHPVRGAAVVLQRRARIRRSKFCCALAALCTLGGIGQPQTLPLALIPYLLFTGWSLHHSGFEELSVRTVIPSGKLLLQDKLLRSGQCPCFAGGVSSMSARHSQPPA